MANTPWDNIQASELRLTALRSRVTADRGLFMGSTPFVMKGKNNSVMNSVFNVTSNDPIVFGTKVISNIGAATRQLTVEGIDLDDERANQVKDILNYAFDNADKRLTKKGLLPLHNALASFACLDGWIGASVVVGFETVKGQKTGNPVFDILPLDILNFNYDIGGSGLIYGAQKYTRTQAQIMDEYGADIGTRIVIPPEGGIIHVYSDKTQNVILFQKIGDDKADIIRATPNTLGKPLCALQPVSLTPMLSDNVQYYGESIYQANRGLYDIENTIASVLMTLVVQSFKAPLQLRSNKKVTPKDASTIRKDMQNAFDAGSILVIGENDQMALLPTRDISQSGPLLLNLIEAEIQRGGLPDVDYGNLTFPLSAVAITQLTGHRDTIYLPRFQALAMLYREICNLIIDQFNAGSYVLSLDNSLGKKISYTKTNLAGNYTVSFGFSAVAAEQTLANLSAARTARAAGYSMRTTLKDICKIEDPQAEMDQIDEETADILVPSRRLYRVAKAKLADAQKLGPDGKKAATAEAALILKNIGFSTDAIKAETGIDFGTTTSAPTPTPAPGVTPQAAPTVQDLAAQAQAQQQGQAGQGAGGLPLGAEMPAMNADQLLNQVGKGITKGKKTKTVAKVGG